MKKFVWKIEKDGCKIYEVDALYHHDLIYKSSWWIFTHPVAKENINKFLPYIGFDFKNQSYVADWAAFDTYEDCANGWSEISKKRLKSQTSIINDITTSTTTETIKLILRDIEKHRPTRFPFGLMVFGITLIWLGILLQLLQR